MKCVGEGWQMLCLDLVVNSGVQTRPEMFVMAFKPTPSQLCCTVDLICLCGRRQKAPWSLELLWCSGHLADVRLQAHPLLVIVIGSPTRTFLPHSSVAATHSESCALDVTNAAGVWPGLQLSKTQSLPSSLSEDSIQFPWFSEYC